MQAKYGHDGRPPALLWMIMPRCHGDECCHRLTNCLLPACCLIGACRYNTYMEVRQKIEESGTDHRWQFDRKRLFEQTNYMAKVCSDLVEVSMEAGRWGISHYPGGVRWERRPQGGTGPSPAAAARCAPLMVTNR